MVLSSPCDLLLTTLLLALIYLLCQVYFQKKKGLWVDSNFHKITYAITIGPLSEEKE